ncbi:actin-like protein arp8 [Lobulomyces angularis]|nr:actin-like protein arp8 [Lobulomyces angularis]
MGKVKRFTSIPKLQNLLSTKSSNVAIKSKRDVNHGNSLTPAQSEIKNETSSLVTKEPKETLILHFGSSYLRVGKATDSFPKQFPCMLARKVKLQNSQEDLEDYNIFNYSIENKSKLDKIVKDRISLKKIKVLPNPQAQVVNFNQNSEYISVADHNDPSKIEWIEGSEDVYFGDMVERLILKSKNKEYEYKVYRPIQNGTFNIHSNDYTSLKQLTNDLELILTYTLREELKIMKTDFNKYNLVLIIPDSFNLLIVEELIDMIFTMGFHSILLHTESVCASFGAGISQCCVVDIGAQVTKICCVEDGLCNDSSIYTLQYGGDDLTKFLCHLLTLNEFPYKIGYENLKVNSLQDFKIFDELKMKLASFNEFDLTSNVDEIYVRKFNEKTKLFKFKTFDEGFRSSLLLFNPEIILFEKKLKNLYYKNTDFEEMCFNRINNICDVQEEEVGNEEFSSDVQMKRNESLESKRTKILPLISDVSLPLDIAIARSISKFAKSNLDNGLKAKDVDDKVRKICSSIVLIGGGSKIPNLQNILEEKLLFLMNLSNSETFGLYKTISTEKKSISVTCNISSREIDSRVLIWKGGNVLSKLEIIKDIWTTKSEWEIGGLRKLNLKCLFNLLNHRR